MIALMSFLLSIRYMNFSNKFFSKLYLHKKAEILFNLMKPSCLKSIRLQLFTTLGAAGAIIALFYILKLKYMLNWSHFL